MEGLRAQAPAVRGEENGVGCGRSSETSGGEEGHRHEMPGERLDGIGGLGRLVRPKGSLQPSSTCVSSRVRMHSLVRTGSAQNGAECERREVAHQTQRQEEEGGDEANPGVRGAQCRRSACKRRHRRRRLTQNNGVGKSTNRAVHRKRRRVETGRWVGTVGGARRVGRRRGASRQAKGRANAQQ